MSELELKDKVAVVTGGAGGIGTAICKAYAGAGAKVVVASRNQENIDKLADDLKAAGADALAVAVDVTAPEQVDNLVQTAVDTFGRIDVLVNNAGGAMTIKDAEVMSPDEWNAVIALNLNAVFYCAAAAGKAMIGQKSGKIVNISSVAGIKGTSNMAPYGAAKAAVVNLTLSLANAWAAYNINVNAIAPGLVATPGLKKAGWIPDRKNDDGTLTPLLLYPIAPESIAGLAVFLASSASDHISGEVIPIRGRIPNDR